MRKIFVFNLIVMVCLSQSKTLAEHTMNAFPTTEELLMTRYDNDTSAVAVILSEEVETSYIDKQIIRYRDKLRIKILREGGLRYAKNYSGGTVYNLEGGEVTVSDADHLKPGSIIDWSTEHVSHDFKTIEPWLIQHEMPVVNTRYTLTTPIDYTIDYERQGDCNISRINKDTILTAVTDKPAFKACRQVFEGRNIPAFNNRQIYCPDDFLIKFIPHLTTITQDNGEIENCVLTWNQVDHQLYESRWMKDFLSTDTPIGKKVFELKTQGKKVYPVFLRRRSSGRLNLKYPSAASFDYMLIAVANNKEDYDFIDPAMPDDSLKQQLPTDLCVSYARILLSPKESVWYHTFIKSDYQAVKIHNVAISPDALLTDSIINYYKNRAYEKKKVRKELGYYSNQLTSADDTVKFSLLPFVQDDIVIPDFISNLPVEYTECLFIRHSITIDISDRFEIVSVPKNENLISQTQSLFSSFNYKRENNKLIIVFSHQRNVMMQLPSAHQYVTEFYKVTLDKLKENVVLKRR